MKKGIISIITAVAGTILFLSSCSEPREVEKYTLIEKVVYNAEDSIKDQYPRTKGDAHSGSYFSRTDSTHQYGIGTYLNVNDTNLNKDIRINVNVWCRANLIEPGYVFAVSVVDKDNVTNWTEIDIKKRLTEPNKWINVVDSITLPAAIFNKPGLIIKTFAFNPNNAAKSIIFDADDLEVTFKKVERVYEE